MEYGSFNTFVTKFVVQYYCGGIWSTIKEFDNITDAEEYANTFNNFMKPTEPYTIRISKFFPVEYLSNTVDSTDETIIISKKKAKEVFAEYLKTEQFTDNSAHDLAYLEMKKLLGIPLNQTVIGMEG